MKLRGAILVCCLCFAASLIWADTLELKNGSVIKGSFVGGTEAQVSFRVGSSVQQYAVADISALKFDGREAGTRRAAPGFASHPAASKIPADAPVPVAHGSANSGEFMTVPAGTKLLVRTIDAVDSDKNRPGDRFLASLEQPLYVDEVLVAPKGASVYGRLEQAQESGQLTGKAELRLSLTGIVLHGQTVALATGDYELSGQSRGASTAKKVGGGAALGALIGAIAGGGKGAAIGAGVGAGAGTAVQVMTKGDQVHVPSETLLEFSLDQPVRVPSEASRMEKQGHTD
ncbi:MAG: hypothetical protein ACRD4F_13670 [Candidatus Angelobacter sp.]